MALLVMIVRNMVKNKWLQISMLLGLTLIVALVSSMPLYTSAILERMLIKELEQLQTGSDRYPGTYMSSSVVMRVTGSAEEQEQRIRNIDAAMRRAAEGGFGLPAHYFVTERRTSMLKFSMKDEVKVDPFNQRYADFGTISGYEQHVRLVDGRLPAADQPVNGGYEVVIVQSAQAKLKLVIGSEVVIRDPLIESDIQVKIVGVIDKLDYQSLFWYQKNLNQYEHMFLLPEAVFERDFTSSNVAPLRVSSWYMSLDYTMMKIATIAPFLDTHQQLKTMASSSGLTNTTVADSLRILSGYQQREEQLRLLLWSMNVPVMIMLAFYLYMVANLIMDRQKTEIAVLRSRGASRWQILVSFLLEGVLLSLVALIAGPPLGLLLTKLLGASNGFLEFVQRSALPVEISREAYEYGVYALGFGLVMMMIPAFMATRASIVGHKQQLARKQQTSFWHKYWLDVSMLAISLYGLNSFERRISDLTAAGVGASQFSIDPLLFLVPAMFILGAGLLLLRLYPFFIRLVYWIGRNWWPPSLYSTLIQVGRSASQYQILMLFLVITIATGLFSASAARTLNQNNLDKIAYKNGADIVMKLEWQSDAPPSASAGGPPAQESSVTPRKVQYSEPPFEHIVGQLPGIEHAAKVFIKKDAVFNSLHGTMLYGINTFDFGSTIWFRDGLLDHHVNDYLNLIASDPSAVLISRSIAEENNVRVGDHITVGWNMVEPRRFVVFGVIDYFPGFMPHVTTPGGQTPKLIVGHLDTIQTLLSLEPYEMWFKLKPDASRGDFIKNVRSMGLRVTYFEDTIQRNIDMMNNPFQLAVNGVMTLGFLISIIVSFFGFLLYWVLVLHGRVLQIGIFRAMGISFRQLVYMLITEQALTSGAAIGIGAMIGGTASSWFVPLFQLSFDPSEQVPPFRVILEASDTVGMFAAVTVMIGAGLLILAYLLSRINIHQAVKLGED